MAKKPMRTATGRGQNREAEINALAKVAKKASESRTFSGAGVALKANEKKSKLWRESNKIKKDARGK